MSSTNTEAQPNYGKRLLPQIIDSWAKKEPSKLYAVTPRSNEAKDLVDITYGQFANAINAIAWWLDEKLGPSKDLTFPCFAYLGPKDLQYAIIAMSAQKVGRRVMR